MRAREQIETEHLIARRLRPEHFEDLFGLLSNPEVMQNVARGKPFSRAETQDWLDQRMRFWDENGFGIYTFFEKSSGIFVGRGGLATWDTTGRIEIGCAFHKRHWRSGFGATIMHAFAGVGFSDLGQSEIFATVRRENIASQRMVEKIGMRFIGEEDYLEMPARVYRLESSQLRSSRFPRQNVSRHF